MILGVGGDPPSAAALDQAVEMLARGWPIGLPTDTVYGLAGALDVAGACDRIFAMKGRNRHVRLPVLVAGLDQARDLCHGVPSFASVLMDRFWPGALTVVLPARPGVAAALGDDDATIGVRSPAHPVALALCRMVGPLATTSANRHGRPPLTTAAEVAAVFGEALPMVLDGGTCAGDPSTVVDCTGSEPRLLRPGRLPWSEVVEALP